MSPTSFMVASASKGAPRGARTALLALLALGALMLSVLAMHSAASAHVMGIPLPVSSSHAAEHELAAAGTAHAGMTAAEHSASTALVAPMGAGMHVATAAVVTMAADHHGMLDCALMVMGCVMLLVLSGLGLLSRPRFLRRLLRGRSTTVWLMFPGGAPPHRPRLTDLCISRV